MNRKVHALSAVESRAARAAGPLVDEIAKPKAQPGKDIIAHGGAGFARSLIAAGVVDEFRLLLFPVVLGKGLPIFSQVAASRRLRVMAITAFPSGAIAHVSRAAD